MAVTPSEVTAEDNIHFKADPQMGIWRGEIRKPAEVNSSGPGTNLGGGFGLVFSRLGADEESLDAAAEEEGYAGKGSANLL